MAAQGCTAGATADELRRRADLPLSPAALYPPRVGVVRHSGARHLFRDTLSYEPRRDEKDCTMTPTMAVPTSTTSTSTTQPDPQTIHVDAEFRDLIPPLRPDERALLEESIVAGNGPRDPLVVWGGLLLDGHNRLEICRAHGFRFETVEAPDVADRAGARLWIMRNQIARRNLTDDQRAMLAAAIADELGKIARKKQQSEAGKQGGKVGGRGRKKIDSETTASAKPIARKPTPRRPRLHALLR